MALVLLIENDEDLSHLLRIALETDGHTVIAAANGNEALKCIRTTTPAVVLTDLITSDKDRLEVVALLRRSNPGVRVIVMSGGCGELSREVFLGIARRIGAFSTLPKPFGPEELKRAIDTALHESSSQPPPP